MKNKRSRNKTSSGTRPRTELTVYEIKILGHLYFQRSKWFEGMKISHLENGESGQVYSLITGPVVDQPALHGLLIKIRDLNLNLISVRRVPIEEGPSEDAHIKPE
jgi:hypothetical protein